MNSPGNIKDDQPSAKMTKKEYNKMYYKKHRNEHLQRFKVRVKCEKCNCEVNRQNLKSHQKSKRCRNNEASRLSDEKVININELVNQLIEIKKALKELKK